MDRLFDISTLNLSTRSYNALHRAGITYVETIVKNLQQDAYFLTHIKNLGKFSEREILTKIEALGFDTNQTKRRLRNDKRRINMFSKRDNF